MVHQTNCVCIQIGIVARINESEDAGEFRLILLAALVRTKLAAFRDKDRVHLRDLVSVGLIDES